MSAAERPTSRREPASRRPSRVLVAVGVGAVVFVAVAAAVWFLRTSDSPSAESSSPPSGVGATGTTRPSTVEPVSARIVSVPELRRLAAAARQPVYWAGARPGTRLEYTRTADGSTYVRYLTGSAPAGAKEADYVVVATYRQPDAYARVSAIAKKQRLSVAQLPARAIAVTKPGRPQNIYVVTRGRPYQVEVYAPTATRTRQLVFGGAVVPVR